VAGALAALAFFVAAVSGAAVALPSCAELATNPAYGLAGNPQVSGVTAVLLSAGVDPSPFPGFVPDSPYSAYCKVDLTFAGESGPSAGYLPGQSQQLKIRVGLPPNSVDIPSPTAVGAVPWNGRNRDIGGGGYAGIVQPVTPSTNLGYVGTHTDTGHSAAVGGAFALNPDGTLNYGLIEDFAADGIHEQHVWGVKLAKAYYGTEPVRKYWIGGSTGGRQGHLPGAEFSARL
jgi:feruloyl esterase